MKSHKRKVQQPASIPYRPLGVTKPIVSTSGRLLHEQGPVSIETPGVIELTEQNFASAIDGQRSDAHAGVPLPHTNHYSVSDNRVDTTLDDGATGSLWWATKNEWLGLLDVAGLHLEALYGGFNREPLDDDSREYVFVARH